jgi:hypothetical protein
MDQSQTQIINVSEAREALTGGDFRNDIAFQNDVNHLISVIDELFDEALLQRVRDRRAAASAPSLHG